MDRSKMISQLEDPSEVFDFLVIGGRSYRHRYRSGCFDKRI